MKVYLNEKLEVDIIGFWCGTFCLLGLTSCLQIDTLRKQRKRSEMRGCRSKRKLWRRWRRWI